MRMSNYILRLVVVAFALVTGCGTAGAADNVVTGAGKTGTLNVSAVSTDGWSRLEAGTGWVMTLEVESNGASMNQWGSTVFALGSNAFPEKNGYNGIQFYLQSSANGGKLNVVFNGSDHPVANVSYNEDFTARLTYDGDKALQICTRDASGNEDTRDYTLNRALDTFSQLSYGLPVGINIKSLAIKSLQQEEDDVTYTVTLRQDDGSQAPEGAGLVYGGQVYTTSFEAADGLQTGVVSAVAVSGYQSMVTYDAATHTFIVVYTADIIERNPTAVVALLDRIGGAGTGDRIETLLDQSLYSGTKDVFVLSQKNGKPLVKGSSISAITAGIGWYLNHYLNVNISWNTLNECASGAYVDLPAMVLPVSDETHTCEAQYRYYLNYCTFGYSMASWSEARWMKEIDWMALHGINAPLQIIGLEKVWKDFLMNDLSACGGTNYSEADAEAFIPGPAFTAWWGMNNLQGWGGDGTNPAAGMQDDRWYDRQQSLARKICAREKELGMQPVLPGFSGMVPTNFQSKSGLAAETANTWCGFQRPAIVDPTGTAFAKLAEKYYERLHAVMNCTSRYYSMDPFHEGGTISSGNYAAGYRAVYDAMDANCGSNTEWIIQQWQWAAYQGTSLTAVPQGRLVVLDLFSDGSPAFDRWSQGYSPQKAIYCTIPNFGGRSGLMGRLQNMTDNYFTYKQKYATIRGIGAAPEAIEQTPVTYDLLFELPWHASKPDIDEWVKSYSTSRYGQANTVAQSAWSTLKQTALNYGADAIQGPVEDVWAAIPNLACNPASAWGSTYNSSKASSVNTPARRKQLIGAVYDLLSQKDVLSGSNYDYDLVEFGSQVLADYAYDLLKSIKTARDAGNTGRYTILQDTFLQLILDVDRLKGTNTSFRLGKWTQEARDAAAEVIGATTATPDWYEEANARTILTTWGDYGQSVAGGQACLRDYSYRSWQGLMRDVYYPRWKYYFDNGCTHPGGNEKNWFYFEWNWAHRNVYSTSDTQKSTNRLTSVQTGYSYSPTPSGSAAGILTEILPRYIGTYESPDGTTTYYYRNLEEIDDTYSGVYRITHSGDGYSSPLYIGYNEDLDNAGNKGYKLVIDKGAGHAAADEYFILSPVPGGYTISAQGMYMKTTATGWEHMMFSGNKAEAGTFVIEQTPTDGVYKIHSNGTGNIYLNAYNTVIGNDAANKQGLSTFRLTMAGTYPLTVSDTGYATLCLPFSTAIAKDMAAYDAAETDISGTGEARMLAVRRIADSNDVLKAGTPVVIKAPAGDYDLSIVPAGEDAKSGVPNSMLHGTYVSTLISDVGKIPFTLDKPSGSEAGFYKAADSGTAISANQAWVELASSTDIVSLSFKVDDPTGVDNICTNPSEAVGSQPMYDLSGRRLTTASQGRVIVQRGTKTFVR
ncbi:MAG: alpha-N-acetylglucosaminidase [Bacteroidaceae bacterium]|nr:alpha-N-acetylglucosaminidase [Bacteroidaceae bacterium]